MNEIIIFCLCDEKQKMKHHAAWLETKPKNSRSKSVNHTFHPKLRQIIQPDVVKKGETIIPAQL